MHSFKLSKISALILMSGSYKEIAWTIDHNQDNKLIMERRGIFKQNNAAEW